MLAPRYRSYVMSAGRAHTVWTGARASAETKWWHFTGRHPPGMSDHTVPHSWVWARDPCWYNDFYRQSTQAP